MHPKRFLTMALALCAPAALAAETMDRYYAHETVTDEHGVIAPWYHGLDGQFACRVRIAAETMKRYPWVAPPKAIEAAPAYVYNGHWSINEAGTIGLPESNDWNNGDLGQRASYILLSLADYYRYSGDPAALAHIERCADIIADHMVTGEDHEWPGILVSVPIQGDLYQEADPAGMIQLDIVAECGLGMVAAYQLTGKEKFLATAKRWGDLLAAYCDTSPGAAPWGRYANPESAPWHEDQMTGGVAFILEFLDELLRMGYDPGGAITDAREAGVDYLHELLGDWLGHDTWGRNFWDWPCPTQVENVTEFAARYFMDHPEEFPNWRSDARNTMMLFVNRGCANPGSGGDVFHGAWAYPESSGCCGRSLWYGPMEVATVFAQYGEQAKSPWGRELARRMQTLSTYGYHMNGQVEDNIDGGAIVAASWFKITHPMALRHVLGTMAWQPDIQGANRENHIMRAASWITDVRYEDGRIAYTAYDAPENSVDVLRLAFVPDKVEAGGRALARRRNLDKNGYTVSELGNGDYVVTVRRDGAKRVVITGDDPQQAVGVDGLSLEGGWTVENGVARTADAGAAMTFTFTGNQVRLIGSAGPEGGLADIYIDGEKQLAFLDAWCPLERSGGVLYWKSGLSNSEHVLKVVARGASNPVSEGDSVWLEGVQWSDATGEGGFGSGGGPTDTQRFVFGRPHRIPYVDDEGAPWTIGTEYVIRTGALQDTVEHSWWTARRRHEIENTSNPELYRYGVYGDAFWVNVTAGPGEYYVKVLLAETRPVPASRRVMDIAINGVPVAERVDIAATAGGLFNAADLVFNGVTPENGVIEVRFTGSGAGQAMLQALEVGPGDGGAGVEPVSLEVSEAGPPDNMLKNGSFEEGGFSDHGPLGTSGTAGPWTYAVVSPNVCYIWDESAYEIHPEIGLPEFHDGQQALRTHTDGDGHTIVAQTVTVEPSTRYAASVWVRGFDLDGKGFGAHEDDSAGLVIQELNADGKLLKSHPKAAVTEAGDYVKVEREFTTRTGTFQVRFILDTVQAGPYESGHVTYDACALLKAE